MGDMTASEGSTPADDTSDPIEALKPHSRWRGPLLLVLKIALVIVGAYLVVEAVRAVDWQEVVQGVTRPQPKPEPNTAKPNETAKQALQQSMDRRW